VALSTILTAANVAPPIITVLRSISISWYIHYDAATELRIISAKAMRDSYEETAFPIDLPHLSQARLPPSDQLIGQFTFFDQLLIPCNQRGRVLFLGLAKSIRDIAAIHVAGIHGRYAQFVSVEAARLAITRASYELLSVPRRVGNGLVSTTFNGLALVIPIYCVAADNL
jgi:hypothetical protein